MTLKRDIAGSKLSVSRCDCRADTPRGSATFCAVTDERLNAFGGFTSRNPVGCPTYAGFICAIKCTTILRRRMAMGRLHECDSQFYKQGKLRKSDLLRFRLDDSFCSYLSSRLDKCSVAAPTLTQTAHCLFPSSQPESRSAVRPLYTSACWQSVEPRFVVRVADQ